MRKKPLIGFIGQGFIGKNYADDFVARGYEVVRYALEPKCQKNKERLKECDIIFIAVPIPTTPQGFDSSLLDAVLPLVGARKTAVIKSTIIPGTCEKFQKKFSQIYLFHSPEFLTEARAAWDAGHPTRNIVGYPVNNKEYRRRAVEILKVLPDSPVNFHCTAREAELIKYASNCFLFTKVIYANIFYDLAQAAGADWEKIRAGLAADPRIGGSHLNPAHKSGGRGRAGRGAGGHCFIKDFAALRIYAQRVGLDTDSVKVLKILEKKNINLLRSSNKDLEILAGVYGKIK